MEGKNMNIKKLIISSICLLVLLSFCFAYAANIELPVNLSVKFKNGTQLVEGRSYTIGVDANIGDNIIITTSAMDDISLRFSLDNAWMNKKGYKVNDKGMAILGYGWDINDPSKATISEDPTTATIKIPSMEQGTTHVLKVAAASAADDYTDDDGNYYIAKVGWKEFTFVMPKNEEPQEKVSLSIARDGDYAVATPRIENGTFKKFTYKWNNGEEYESTQNPLKLILPVEVGTHTLKVRVYTNNNLTAEDTFTYEVKGGTTPEEKVTLTIEKDGDYAVATPKIENGTFKKFTYKWDNEPEYESTNNPLRLVLPTTVGVHTLRVRVYTNNNVTAEKTFTYEVKEQGKPSTPVDDDLIVEDWMKENKDLESLAVSLRNDSEQYDKANRNMYALGEEVIYYVDYKNGGRTISQPVDLVLELPLEFDVVDSFGGTVDKENKKITWNFKDGLEKEQEGTKVVKIKYTSLGKSSTRSATVYPSAKIYVDSAKSPKDISTVINYIFKDEDTEMREDHNPYMFGDANATTFRPDDTITRAEGALVLARIFGINYSGTTVTGNEFSDIGETYVEAQKAIVASTKMGLISGYPDGTYKPKNKMTKAEFMKIIGAYVEAKAEDDNIKGLEVKDIENAIKLYKNRTSTYIVGNDTVKDHWAISYVTLLTRINMTPISESQKSIGLDDEITRAEVAQLVNYYLLRAPQDSGKTAFSDVSRNHKLYGDILEATIPVHSFTITHEGTEVVVD